MTDPRLSEWLELALAALAEAPRGEALDALAARRDALLENLRRAPPAQPPDAELRQRLADAERRLAAALAERLVEARARLAELRRVRGAHTGYRPARSGVAAFVSKAV